MSKFNANYADYSMYDSEVIQRLIEIDKKIKEEKSKEIVNEKKLTKLRMEQLMKGMELGYNQYVL